MDSLVTHVLSKYFKLVVKDFKKEQFKCSLLKGSAELTNSNLDEDFIQDLLMIPPNMRVKNAECTSLTVDIPNVTKLNQRPVTLSLDRVNLSLEEPEVLIPLKATKAIADLEDSESGDETPKTRKKKSSFASNLIRDMCVKLEEFNLDVKLLPRSDMGDEEPWAPHLCIEAKGVVLESTTSDWETATTLSESKESDKETRTKKFFKKASCKALTVSLLTGVEEETLPICHRVPAEVRVTMTMKDNVTESVQVETRVGDVCVACDELSWQLLVKLFSSLKLCFGREVETDATVKEVHEKRKKDMTATLGNLEIYYSLVVRQWFLQLGSGMEGKRGFLFSGSGLRFSVSPRVANIVAGEVDSHESRVEIAVRTVELKQLFSGVTQKNECLVSQSAANDKDSHFISAAFRHTWARLDRPKSTQLLLNIDGLCVVLDREVWLDLFKFLSGSIIATLRHDMKQVQVPSADELTGKMSGAMQHMSGMLGKLKTVDLGEYFEWYYNSSVSLSMTNTEIILPKDTVKSTGESGEGSGALTRALRLRASKLSLSNKPSWKDVPFVNEALVELPSSEFLAFFTDPAMDGLSDSANRFQADIADVSLESWDPDVGLESTSSVFLPTSLRVFGRMLDLTSGGRDKPRLELAVNAECFHLTINEAQEEYLRNLLPVYQAWLDQVRGAASKIDKKAIVSAKDTIQTKAKNVMEKAKEVVKEHEEKIGSIIDKVSSKETLAKVEEVIDEFRCIVVVRAEKGKFQVPLHSIDIQRRTSPESPEDSPVAEHIPLASVTFTGLGFVLENSARRKTVLLHLQTLSAENIDHPRSPTSVLLLPLQQGPSSSLGNDAHHQLKLSAQRIQSEGDDSAHTEIAMRLQGVQIACQAKRAAMRSLQQDFQTAIPELQRNLQRLVAKVTGMVSGIRDDQQKRERIKEGVLSAKETVKDNLDAVKKKVQEGVNMAEKALDFLDISWEFEIADCEVLLQEAPEQRKAGRKPFGVVRVSTFQKAALDERFGDLEQQLVVATMSSAEKDGALHEASRENQKLAEELAACRAAMAAQVDAAKKELEEVEQLLIQTKMKLIEAQIENESLKHK